MYVCIFIYLKFSFILYLYALYPLNGSYGFNGNLLTKLNFIGFLEIVSSVQLFTLFNVSKTKKNIKFLTKMNRFI